MDDEAHLAFTQYLGAPEANHVKLGQEGIVEYFGTIGNVQPDGSTIGNDPPRTIFQTGNNMWHSDSSFRHVPPFVSIMCAYEVPDEGGRTAFVSVPACMYYTDACLMHDYPVQSDKGWAPYKVR